MTCPPANPEASEELAQEDVERRHARDCQPPDQEEGAGDRHDLDDASDLRHHLRPESLAHGAAREEHQRLGDGVVHDVEERGEEPDEPPEADREGDYPHVLDARVGEHPLHVLREVHRSRGDAHRQQPEDYHQLAREGWPERAGGDDVEPQDSVDGAVEEDARQEGAHRASGASPWASGSHVCIGAMPAFVPSPTRTKTKATLTIAGSSRLASAVHARPVHRRARRRGGGGRVGVGEEDNPEEGEGQPDSGDYQVLPGGLNGPLRGVEHYHEDGDESRRFDGHPHQPHVVRQGDEQHRKDEEVEALVVPDDVPVVDYAALVLPPHVVDRVERRDEAHARYRDQHQGPKRVQVEEVAEAEKPVLRDHAGDQPCDLDRHKEGGQQGGRLGRPLPPRERDEAPPLRQG